MQLEKTHSSEAGLAGWISSNDVTLFTMVLVVIIAIFLHTNLIRGANENEKLTDRNAELSDTNQAIEENLAQTRERRDQLDADLKERRQELQKTTEDLQAARTERNALNRQLEKEIERITQLNQSLQQLTLDNTNLERDKAQLTGTRDTLTREKANLTKSLAELSSTLEAKVRALKDAEQQRDHLNEQSKTLDGIIATLQTKLSLANEDLESLKHESSQQLAEVQKQVAESAEMAAVEASRADDYLSRLRRAADLFQGMKAEKQTLESQVTNLEDRYEQQLAREATISRELVGLQGDLTRVAFLFDASGSMKKSGSTDDQRWAEAQGIAATWLAHLDVDECVLVVFSSDVRTFPKDGTMIQVSGPDSEANRAPLLEPLNAVEPSGWTNTLDALRTAYTYEDLDTIILFSDGAPTNPATGRFDQAVVQQIYSLCREHGDVPINTIGLGNYFDEQMAAVLRNLASMTGGTFRGR
ncbi:MAG: VWA domain-containing protein [Pirellulaceae bacterium]